MFWINLLTTANNYVSRFTRRAMPFIKKYDNEWEVNESTTGIKNEIT